MKHGILATIATLIALGATAQVGINTTTPDAGAVLDVYSTSQGLLLPRIASDSDVSNPVNGLIIYDESDGCINVYANGVWVNPCSATSSTDCGSGYTPVEMKSVEISPEYVGVAVSVDGHLYVAGDLNDAYRAFGGLSTSQELYDWSDYHDESLSVTPPFNAGQVACVDITNNTTNRNSRVILGTTTGDIYTIQAPNATWTKGTYAGSTPVDVQASNGFSVVDDAGDVWYSTDGTSFTQVNIGPSMNGIKTEHSESLNSGYTTLKHYAWNSNNDTLYYWFDDPSTVSTFTFPANVVDVDHDNNRGAAILLADGSIYLYDGTVLGVTAGSTPTATTISYTSNNTRSLAAGEYFVHLETAITSAVAVTNLGNFYTYNGSGWYFEYEISAKNPDNVDFSGAADRGFSVIIDGRMHIWGSISAGSSDAHTGAAGGIFGDASMGVSGSSSTLTGNSPMAINVCRAD